MTNSKSKFKYTKCWNSTSLAELIRVAKVNWSLRQVLLTSSLWRISTKNYLAFSVRSYKVWIQTLIIDGTSHLKCHVSSILKETGHWIILHPGLAEHKNSRKDAEVETWGLMNELWSYTERWWRTKKMTRRSTWTPTVGAVPRQTRRVAPAASWTASEAAALPEVMEVVL